MGWRKAKRAAGEVLEGVGEVVDKHERIGAWFGALGAIGGGVLIYIGPGTMAEEIPIHRELGLGFGAFGFVFLLALIFKGQAGYRARSLLMAMLAAVIGTGLGWVSYSVGLDVYDLYHEGEYRDVSVTGTRRIYDSYNKTSSFKTEVNVDGERVTVDLTRLPKRGEVVHVLVVPRRPAAIVPGHVEQNWMPLVDEVIGRWIAMGILIGLLFCGLAVPFKLWDTVFGAAKGVDPDEW
ncbi:MAG: hypothetical protein O2816_10055 [Planctomycetota bacterium]|nr:hypothetical protein [Planctomycetota bacterium]